ncbi:MAG: hypothetical protein ACFFKA_09870, partial [Candidatus Thorarchaeota archaeon]
MKFEPEMLDKKTNNIIFFLITLLTLFLISSMFLHRLHSNTDTVENNRNLSQPDNFDILDFWEKEIERVNNTPLNINMGDNFSILYSNPFTSKQYVLNAQDIYFDSPNWINSN